MAAAVGLTDGTAQNDDCGWLHFIEDNGLELYIAKKTIRYNLCWEQLNAKGLSIGGAEVTIGGVVYVVRLLTGGVPPNNDLVTGGEWNRYMYNVYTMADRSTFPPEALYWAYYTGPMLGVATVDASTEVGTASICSDNFTNVGHITRGSDVSNQLAGPQIKGIWYVGINSPVPTAGWRPVLVNKVTMPPSPYKGEVLPSSFISGADLATAVGFTTSTLVNPDTPWLKFQDLGKTFYISKKVIGQNLAWAQLDALGLIKGTKTIVIGGLTYKVRVMTGGNGSDPTNTAGGEYDNYFLRTTTSYSGAGEAWVSNAPADMGWNGNVSAGSMIICQEGSTQGGHVLRGYPGFTGIWYEPDDVPNVAYGWRPVLELVP